MTEMQREVLRRIVASVTCSCHMTPQVEAIEAILEENKELRERVKSLEELLANPNSQMGDMDDD